MRPKTRHHPLLEKFEIFTYSECWEHSENDGTTAFSVDDFFNTLNLILAYLQLHLKD